MPRDPLPDSIEALQQRFPSSAHKLLAVVSLAKQTLSLYRDGNLVKTYPVSTSKYGAGNQDGSYRTPLGVHSIKEKIGGDAPFGTIFKARKNTHQVAAIVSGQTKTAHDFITSRILWLEGQEPGINRGQGIDSYARSIYIHGTHEEGLIGQPVSIGCIRMRNRDVVELYDRIRKGDLVVIVE